mgnify:CR=1 FL=1
MKDLQFFEFLNCENIRITLASLMYVSYHALPEICYEKSDNSSAISVRLMWYQSSHEVHPTNLTFPDLHDSHTEQCRGLLLMICSH